MTETDLEYDAMRWAEFCDEFDDYDDWAQSDASSRGSIADMSGAMLAAIVAVFAAITIGVALLGLSTTK